MSTKRQIVLTCPDCGGFVDLCILTKEPYCFNENKIIDKVLLSAKHIRQLLEEYNNENR